MRKLITGAVALATIAWILTTGSPSYGGGVIKTTVPHCSNAYAILGWSERADEKVWDKVGWTMYTRPHLEITSDVQKGVVQKATFRQYGVRGHDTAVAYVVHCGHGGTCNQIAEAYFRRYKRHGIPAVYCGPLPGILETASTPSIPKPDLTDYYKAEPSYDYDDEDDDAALMDAMMED